MDAWSHRLYVDFGCNRRNLTTEDTEKTEITENRLRNMPFPLCSLCRLCSSVVKNVWFSALRDSPHIWRLASAFQSKIRQFCDMLAVSPFT